MELLTSKISRYLFAIPMVIFGLLHFVAADQMAGMVPIPGGAFWVYLTGLGLVAGGVSLMIRKMDYWAGIALGAMLLIFVLTIHLPGVMGGNESSMPMLLKDTAMAGGAFMLAGMGKKTM